MDINMLAWHMEFKEAVQTEQVLWKLYCAS